MKRILKPSEINHLRHLVGWIRCEIGQTPEEYLETMRKIAPVIHDAAPDGLKRLSDGYDKAVNVPQYIRNAVKQLEKLLEEYREFNEVEGTASREKQLMAPAQKLTHEVTPE